ncbi:hypothetical protein VitviT2T_026210 [Vitis vinifera]|uniref:DYW domain-containing protein n=2 Tax=Vitis vinifera TaxID=29760 RepID=A0ABY9DNA4_VITVI|eukprot:XP_002281558.1 PREDICTED: pentatricopeptide repeat-containing protein At2g02980, chloroplastic [Vitis vinifera]
MKRSVKSFLQARSNLSQWTHNLTIRPSSTSALTLCENPPQITESKHSHLTKSISNHAHMNQMLSQMIMNYIPIDHLNLMKLIDFSVSSHGFAASALLFTQFYGFIDSDLCNSMIRCYTDSNKHLHSVFIYTQMWKNGIFPDSSTFPTVLKSVAQLCRQELGKAIHCCIIQMGFESNVYVSTALVNMYGTCSSVSDARQVFDEIPDRNIVSWNALITGYNHNRMFRKVIDVFREMQIAGAKPVEVTMVGVLLACAHLGALNQGRWIDDYIDHNRLRLNVFVGTALIDMYAKCGVVDEAEKIFKAMRVKNVYTWNVLISGYAMNGRGESALQAFSRMIMEKFKPDEVTFLGVLCACCHQGLVNEGRTYFTSMKEEFGLRPRIEHYGCMVDLLGRAGFLDEAQQLIQAMSMQPDPIIWRELLGACRIHGNIQLGEFAIKKLLELEPNNGENYVLLANLYARDQRWDKVGEVREMMDCRRVRKVPGCSSIEIDNVVYEFVVSNYIKPGFEEVYKLLADMNKKLKLAGYVADTGMASYDIEEEEKEHSLMYHSEKLALAFGLLKSPSGLTLRIVKNLRICQDCHGFFKIVSKVYRRDISVRDRNRFHHFVGGACSCKDYW